MSATEDMEEGEVGVFIPIIKHCRLRKSLFNQEVKQSSIDQSTLDIFDLAVDTAVTTKKIKLLKSCYFVYP